MKTSLKQNLGKKIYSKHSFRIWNISSKNIQTITESIIEAITGALLKK